MVKNSMGDWRMYLGTGQGYSVKGGENENIRLFPEMTFLPITPVLRRQQIREVETNV